MLEGQRQLKMMKDKGRKKKASVLRTDLSTEAFTMGGQLIDAGGTGRDEGNDENEEIKKAHTRNPPGTDATKIPG